MTIKKRAKKEGSLYAKVRAKEIAGKLEGVTEKMIEKVTIEKIGKYKVSINLAPKIKSEVIVKVGKKSTK